MTYNFDPDRWFDNEMAWLEGRLREGELSADLFARKAADLEERHARMWQRLDGTYRITNASADQS